MKQYDIILKAMLNNRNKKEWKASDFQKEPYFVGYEASPRMSELARMYPDLINTGRDGRFRTLSINWECENIEEYIDRYVLDSYNPDVKRFQKYINDVILKHIPRID